MFDYLTFLHAIVSIFIAFIIIILIIDIRYSIRNKNKEDN